MKLNNLPGSASNKKNPRRSVGQAGTGNGRRIYFWTSSDAPLAVLTLFLAEAVFEEQADFSTEAVLALSAHAVLAASQLLASPACKTGTKANATTAKEIITFFIMLSTHRG